MLIDKILVGENKEIEVIFNHQEEVAFLEAMANNREEKQDHKQRILLQFMKSTVQKTVESEVCYG